MPTDPPHPEGCTILHVDMDAFFASVEIRDFPELKGKPVVVGGNPHKRGVVSAASYEARAYGIHSALPSRTAYARCPHAIFRPGRMSRYQEVSREIMDIFHHFTPFVEKLSVDEAFLDIQGVLWKWKDPALIATAIKEEIKIQTQLTASVGVAPNKFLAKLASDMDKPDGLTLVPSAERDIIQFLAPLPVEKIWGVGKKTLQYLHGLGIRTISDLQGAEKTMLEPTLGQDRTQHLIRLAHGQDFRRVETHSDTKSISSENTFDQDIQDPEKLQQYIFIEVEDVGRRLRASGLYAKTATLKFRHNTFETYTRQTSLPQATQSDHDLFQAARTLFNQQSWNKPVRLIGFGVSGLSTTAQSQQEFNWESKATPEHYKQLDKVKDHLRKIYGPNTIQSGTTLNHPKAYPQRPR